MAYDPYSRGDNPWLGNLDMPRSNPAARPKAGGASKTAPAKKKAAPAERYASTKGGGPGTGVGSVVPPRRPLEFSPAAQPSEGDYPPPPRVTGPEVTAPLALPPAEMGTPTSHPNIQGGLLQSMPLKSPAEQLQPVGPAAPSPLPFANSPAGNPALQPTQTTGADQMGASLMNYLRSQLFNQGRPFDPNQPSGSIY